MRLISPLYQYIIYQHATWDGLAAPWSDVKLTFIMFNHRGVLTLVITATCWCRRNVKIQIIIFTQNVCWNVCNNCRLQNLFDWPLCGGLLVGGDIKDIV